MNFSDSDFLYDAGDLVTIVRVKLQNSERVLVRLDPQVEVSDLSKSSGCRINRVNPVGEFKSGDGEPLLTDNVAVPWAFGDEDG